MGNWLLTCMVASTGGLGELALRFSLHKAIRQIDSMGESVCPIARSPAVVGGRWTILLVRELFMGTRRFDEIQAQTAMPSHLLSIRLRRLAEAEVCKSVSCLMADSLPSRLASRLTFCRVSERCPQPLNVCLRVRFNFTGRPTFLAAMALITECGQMNP